MKGRFKNLKNIQKILIVVILVVVLMPLFFNSPREAIKNSSNSNNNKSENVSQVEDTPSKYQLQMIQATTQLALERNGFKNDTSHSLEDWEIKPTEYNDTIRWNSITQSTNNGRVKAIFDWNGEDDNDLILKYLLVNGNEIVNDLKNNS